MNRRTYAVSGFILGFGAPLGWLVFRALILHGSWVMEELKEFGPLYAYLTIATVVVFAVFGYLIGWRTDLVARESQLARATLEKVNVIAETDALTGLRNARYLHDQLALEIESALRYRKPLTCLMIDIDNFKTVND